MSGYPDRVSRALDSSANTLEKSAHDLYHAVPKPTGAANDNWKNALSPLEDSASMLKDCAKSVGHDTLDDPRSASDIYQDIDTIIKAAEKADAALTKMRDDTDTTQYMKGGNEVQNIESSILAAKNAADGLKTRIEVEDDFIRSFQAMPQRAAAARPWGLRGMSPLEAPFAFARLTLGEDKLLQLTQKEFEGVSDLTVNMLLNAAAKRTLQAWRPYLGFAPGLWEAILSNPINKKTLDFISHRKSELADFIIDLMEPVKRFVRSDSDERTTVCDLNAFNELDLTKPMNRHAAMCQIQRLLKSIVSILHGQDQDKSLADFVMDTRLDSDCDDAITDVIQDSIGTNTPETWFFINGIAGESQWLKLALNKLKARLGHGEKNLGTITGIFNRGDGILWDLIECAGQRCAENGTDTDNVIQRTKSSQKAESLLKNELLKVFTKERAKPDNEQDPIVVIAHSQGCLLLRLVLEELASDPGNLAIMQKSLMVFTFGNPSVDWEIHKSCNHTEHYANEKDFVAWLGVLRQDDDDSSGRFHYGCADCSTRKEGHPKQRIFINKGKKGHLFGAHYDLEEGAYECFSHTGERSRLFTGK